jgi:hypothetical protein
MRQPKTRDNPEWTPEMIRKARPVGKVFPGLALPKPRKRDPQTATNKQKSG